jgi:hypothetical protein
MNGIDYEEHEGTVPDLRTERSGVVESALSPADRNAASFAVEFGCGERGYLAELWHHLWKCSSCTTDLLEHTGLVR